MDNANASEGVISLPGWGIRPPILINATKCSIEIVLEDSSSQLDPALMFELSKLRLYAITCLSMKSGLKKFSDFCDSHFQSASANLLIPGGVSALNIAALHGNLEVKYCLYRSILIMWILLGGSSINCYRCKY